jgi:hypothetical protein
MATMLGKIILPPSTAVKQFVLPRSWAVDVGNEFVHLDRHPITIRDVH